MNKKAQTGGLITGIVMGVAGLVIAVIIAFIIISTLSGANLLTSGRNSFTVTNETGGYINATGYTLGSVGGNNLSYSVTIVWNGTTVLVIGSGNYTLDSVTGIITNATATTWEDVNISYTHQAKASEELSTERLSGNFTEGIDNVSGKIPTVLLIAVIVLVLGILVFLVAQWQRMRLGGGGSSL